MTVKKIAIVGCCGSGKSTLAKMLSPKTGLPIIHLDHLFWKSGWVQRDYQEYQILHDNEVVKNHWIIEGNQGKTMPQRFAAADMIIILDYPKWFVLARLFKRIIHHYGRTRDDMAEGCHERWDWDFIKYVWNFDRITRPKIISALNGLSKDKQIIWLKTHQQTTVFLEHL